MFSLPAAPCGHVTRASSDRFLIPYMKPDLDRAIILDVDMLSLGDIQKLWEIDLENFLLAAVPVYCWTSMKILEDIVSDTGMFQNHIYFNMGTLIVNCKKWREENILQKISGIKIEFDTQKYFYWEEILLNLVLQENQYKIIDPKFNMMIPHQAYYKCGKPKAHRELIEGYAKLSKDYNIEEIIFSHFAMPQVKPWNTDKYFYPPVGKWIEIPNFKEFWYYLKMTPFYDEEQMRYLSKIVYDTIWQGGKSIPRIMMKKARARFKYIQYKIINLLTLGLVQSIKEKREIYKNLYKNE